MCCRQDSVCKQIIFRAMKLDVKLLTKYLDYTALLPQMGKFNEQEMLPACLHHHLSLLLCVCVAA